MKGRLLRTAAVGLLLAAFLVGAAAAGFAQAPGQVPLAGRAISKFVDPLPHFAGARVPAGGALTVSAHEFQQMVLPATMYAALAAPFNAGTYVWGYKVSDGTPAGTFGPHYPGFTLEATRGVPATITYVNNLPLPTPLLQQYLLVDQTLHWANPLGAPMTTLTPYVGPAPIVTHLHGGEVLSDYDGGPEQWFTPNGLRGPTFRTLVDVAPNAAVYLYPNNQEPTTLWFHDHMLGGTRLNVYAGLAAFYLLRDGPAAPAIERPDLPGGPADTTVVDPLNPAAPYKPEIEIAIQDRMFDTNGQLYFPSIGINIDHPFWIPEFVGDTIVVNGKTWPYLNVEPRRYRFRLLDGSNARFYSLTLESQGGTGASPTIWQIGSDGGLLNAPVPYAAPNRLLIAPGERADLIIDFAGFAGQTLTLANNARAPYPRGANVDPQTTGQIMQFRVGLTLSGGADLSYNPAIPLFSPRLAPIAAPINAAAATVKRQLTLNEIMGPGGPLQILVNNTKWNGKDMNGAPIPGSQPDSVGNWLTELPLNGSTEVWEIINLTADAHPIHLHLVQFQLQSRQDFQLNKYFKAYNALFPMGLPMGGEGPPLLYTTPNADGAVGGNPAIGPFLQQAPAPALPQETGWKDTVIMYPGQVTRIAVRFTAQDGTPFAFNPTGNPGYVWHCHIIDHEDNEMMRPYQLR